LGTGIVTLTSLLITIVEINTRDKTTNSEIKRILDNMEKVTSESQMLNIEIKNLLTSTHLPSSTSTETLPEG
jgi:hypothetical protein